jgi:undecaprenyl-diphosphatase
MFASIFYLLWGIHTLLESLPISSSGHMRLILNYLNRYTKGPTKIVISEYLDYSMHTSTLLILAIFLSVHWKILFNGVCSPSTLVSFLWYIFVANTITIACYLIYRLVDISRFPLMLGLSITAVELLSLYFVPQSVSSCITAKHAFVIGLAQGCALLPGISRLGTTYVVGCWLGLNSPLALLFSCAIQLPLVLAAVAKGLFLLLTRSPVNHLHYAGLFFVLLASVGAYGLLALLLSTSNNQLWVCFGIYMILPLSIAFFQNRTILA